MAKALASVIIERNMNFGITKSFWKLILPLTNYVTLDKYLMFLGV